MGFAFTSFDYQQSFCLTSINQWITPEKHLFRLLFYVLRIIFEIEKGRGGKRRQRITDSTSFLQIRQSDGYPEKKNKEKWNGIIHFFLLLSLPEENIEPKPKRFPEWTFRIGFTWTTLLYEPCTFFNGGFWYPIEDEQCCEFFGAFLWELCFWVTPSFDNVVRLIFGAEPVELLRDRSGNGHKLRV